MNIEKKVIGICTSGLEQAYHKKAVDRLIKELTITGNRVMVFASDSDMYLGRESDKGDACIFDLPNYEMLDVLVIYSTTILYNDILMDIVGRAKAANVPVVSIDMEIDGCHNVIFNTDEAFERLVRHVIEYHGMREVNFITGQRGNAVAERRLEIFKQVLADNDIPVEEDRIGYGDFWEGPTYEVMKEFMRPEKVPPEAIICANDSMAVAVCDYLGELDFHVPEEILVTGFDGIDEAKLHSPAITTAVRDEVNDAKAICDLVNRSSSGKKVVWHMERNYHMQLSQSCGCQKYHLFDHGRLIRKLNSELALRIADIRRYADIEENILQYRESQEYIKQVKEILPENSFLCINEDLLADGEKAGKHLYNAQPFTENLQAVVNIGGTVSVSICSRDRIVPEEGEELPDDWPVIIMPLHFEENAVGYFGIWEEELIDSNTISLLHLTRALDNSLASCLSKK